MGRKRDKQLNNLNKDSLNENQLKNTKEDNKSAEWKDVFKIVI